MESQPPVDSIDHVDSFDHESVPRRGYTSAATSASIELVTAVDRAEAWGDLTVGVSAETFVHQRSIPPGDARVSAATGESGGSVEATDHDRVGVCRFPGCNRARFTDAHTVVNRAERRETRLANLAMLCRFHHRLVHDGGIGIRALDDGALIFTTPDGRRIGPPRVAWFSRIARSVQGLPVSDTS